MYKPSEGITDEVLRYFVPFNTLPADRLQGLLKQIRVEQAKPGDFLFREGDTEPHSIYLLLGRVSLLNGTREASLVTANTGISRLPIGHRLPRQQSGRAKDAVTYFRIDNRMLAEASSATQSASSSSNFQVDELEDVADDDDWMAHMLNSPVIQMVPPANIQNALMKAERIELKAHEWVIRQGEPGDFYYMLHRGRCQVVRQETPDSPYLPVADLEAGQSFGEEALLSDRPRGHSVQTITPVVLIRLAKKHFMDLIHRPLSNRLMAEEARTKAKSGGVWLDVRNQAEYLAGHMKDAIHCPSQQIREECSILPKDCDLLVYGTTSGQASAAAFLLTERGFNRYRVFSMECGYTDLVASEEYSTLLPLVSSNNVTDVDARLAQAEQQCEEYRSKLTEIQTRYEEVLRKRLNENQVLNRAVEALKQKITEAQGEKQTHQARYNSLREELERTRSILEAIRQESVLSGPTDTVMAAQQMRGLEAELAAERERNGMLQAEKGQLRATLKAAQDLARQAQSEIAQTQADYEDELAGLKTAQQMRGLSAELTAAREKNQALNAEKENLRTALKASQDKVKQAEAELVQSQTLYEDELDDLRQRYAIELR